jgi:hypothetical protein
MCFIATRLRSSATLSMCILGAAQASGAPEIVPSPDGFFIDNFGRAIALQADTLIVGAPLQDVDAQDDGAVYVLRWTSAGWSLVQKLDASDGVAFDSFGISLALDGDTLVVGASNGDGAVANSGAAYIFTRTGGVWTEQQKLVASDGAASDTFGGAVSISGDSVVIGAGGDDDQASSSGSAYVFTNDGGSWSQQQKLDAQNGYFNRSLGASVAIDGDSVIVGGPGQPASGEAWVFVRAGGVWSVEQQLVGSEIGGNDRFGQAVFIRGDTAIVTASLDDGQTDTIANAGAAYVFKRTAGVWAEQVILRPFDATTTGQFGQSVHFDGETLAIGAQESFTGDAGAVYLYRIEAGLWVSEGKVVSPTGYATAQFGSSVAVDGDLVAAGGPFFSPGYAFITERVGDRWVGGGQQLRPNDSAILDQYGNATATSGDWLVVGSRSDTVTLSGQGSVRVLRRAGSSYRQTQLLVAPDAATGDNFGHAVAIDGDTLAVGAIGDDISAGDDGSVYVFVYNGSSWVFEQKITPTIPNNSDHFGEYVAIDGDTIVVGSPDRFSAGAVEVYFRSAGVWAFQADLNPGGLTSGADYGQGIAISGETVIAGAPLHDINGITNRGVAYVFTRSGASWAQQGALIPMESTTEAAGLEGDNFGASIAMDGDLALIGAPLADPNNAFNHGAAYLFRSAGGAWSEYARLATPGAIANNYGRSVALRDGVAMVGSIVPIGSTERVAVFRRYGDDWVFRGEIVSPNPANDADFGAALALGEGVAVVGSPFENGSLGSFQGNVWVYPTDDHAFGAVAHNATLSVGENTLAAAIATASAGDAIYASSPAISFGPATNTSSKRLDVIGTGALRLPFDQSVAIRSGSTIATGIGTGIDIYGVLDIDTGASANTQGGALRIRPDGLLTLGLNTTLDASASSTALLEGVVDLGPGAGAAVGGPIQNTGDLSLTDATLQADGGTTNANSLTIIAGAIHDGDFTNNMVTSILSGTFTVLGSIVDNGLMIGDFEALRASPGGLFVQNNYSVGGNATLSLVGGRLTSGGDIDVAINDNTRFDLATSEVRLTSTGGPPQTFERMSRDVGASPDGLNRTLPGHYPLGALRIGPLPTTVDLVDNNDNDNLGQATCEAVYVGALIIDAGSTLNTNGCPVYYQSLTNNGSVDDANNLIQIVDCPADFNHDGVVSGPDLAALLAAWNTGSPVIDLNGDGEVDGADLAGLLAAWGVCN